MLLGVDVADQGVTTVGWPISLKPCRLIEPRLSISGPKGWKLICGLNRVVSSLRSSASLALGGSRPQRGRSSEGKHSWIC